MLGAHSAFWRFGAFRRTGNETQLIEEPDLAMALIAGPDGNTLVVYGEPERAVGDMRRLRGSEHDFVETMINRETYEALDSSLREYYGPHWGYAWDFFWTQTPLKPVDHCERVEFLRAGSAQLKAVENDVRNALIATNPITGAIDRFADLDWFILRADNGEIVTVMGATQGEGMSFEGLGTVPKYRGLGYGGATMVGAVNLALQLVNHVQFGVWAWNMDAMRLYRRLGLNHDGALITGRTLPFDDLRSKT
ncbi:GNAT superfamily N-acetyltransferase [Trueperella bonasi]|uniref:GNAT superfamily N-acetyltransferase n=1 Tax=Trueperella bonasi TaxID=312286 RepID=A0ABT9NDG9_9ACTO|nr:GNAT family N-acetyltransferase [Trueperella bonasi]MDP9805426.1 GNAT superfamily N-acetyltransferase [Trueperella bonasi]